ncbi:hypothetical protein [Paenarthrobacter ureafaciens]|uniref:hypothetical protein n=1 Tax=Paenarthrobacter ureafaciens TaxID=37931 RepID=UPI001409B66D|nr:hypothetical protein [Paenarthrobacter ureafaciens]MCX8453511.1 hypothetical protein [Paenarthrobacter ureafaciens]MCY0973170.1 hypothetical protein [Paenarthrobacter ureafaciens]QQQ63936.1 hypothetical protein JHQ56_09205 [Paenarthrobacter ureafaciens]
MSKDVTIRRLVRRETHSSRAVPSIVVASLLMVASLWLALESVLWLLKDQPLLASPAEMFRWVIELPANTTPTGLVASGAGLGILALVLFGLAFGRGRRQRRTLVSQRAAVVVDHEVIAAAVSRKVRRAAGLAPGQVTTTVGGRSVRVQVRPTSGEPLVPADIQSTVDGELAAYALDRPVRSSVNILNEGAVGQ